MAADPIFIVGVPRSGTTLLAAMLTSHSELNCGPETHFFSHLNGRSFSERIFSKTWPECGVNLLKGIQPWRSRVVDDFNLTDADLSSFLSTRPASVQSLLECLTVTHMTRAKKRRWAEKTPDHMLHSAAIRKIYPHARIIRLVRDPRAVAQSLARVPWGESQFLDGIHYWLSRDIPTARVFSEDRDAITVRYEDLVRDPERKMRDICKFCDLSFEASMLTPQQNASSVVASHETWKRKNHSVIDSGNADSWRDSLEPSDNLASQCVVHERLKAYEYSQDFSPVGTVTLMYGGKLSRHAELLRRFSRERIGVRLIGLESQVHSDKTVIIVSPEFEEYLGKNFLTRLVKAASIVVRAICGRVGLSQACYVTRTTTEAGGKLAGIVSRACKSLDQTAVQL